MRLLSVKSVLLVMALSLMTACSAPEVDGVYVDDTNTRYTFSEGVVKFKLGGLFNMEASYVQDGDEVTILIEGGEKLVYEFNGDGDLYSESEDDLLKRVSTK